MKCIALLLAAASCASAHYLSDLNYAPMVYSGYYGSAVSPLWRKKRAAPEDPADDQKADEALMYSYFAGYPYSSYYDYYHLLKKREAPAEDQKAQEALLYSTYYGGYPYYSSYYGTRFLRKKRDVDQEADDSLIYYSSPMMYSAYSYPFIYKK